MLKKNKVLIVFVGHAFRNMEIINGNIIKDCDSHKSVHQQLQASNTHNFLIKYLQNKHNIECDYCVATYNSKHKNILSKYYKNSILNITLNEALGYPGLINYTNKILHEKQLFDNYDTIFYLRLDMILSEYMIRKIIPIQDKITHTHLLGPPGDPARPAMDCILEDMYVSDFYIQIPKRFFSVITPGYFPGHVGIKNIIRKHKLNRYDFNFLVDTIHRAGTHKSWNPLYIVTNKPFNHTHRFLNPRVVYCEESFKLKTTDIFKNSIPDLIKHYTQYNSVSISKDNTLYTPFSSQFLQIVEPKNNFFDSCEKLNKCTYAI